MADLSGIGKSVNMESGSTSGCTMTTNSQATTSGLCDRVDCSSYGKWWCPFTGW